MNEQLVFALGFLALVIIVCLISALWKVAAESRHWEDMVMRLLDQRDGGKLP